MTNTPAMDQKIRKLESELDNVRNYFQSKFAGTLQKLNTSRSSLLSKTNFTVNILHNFYNDSLEDIKALENIIQEIEKKKEEQESQKTEEQDHTDKISPEPDLNAVRDNHIDDLKNMKDSIDEQVKKHKKYLSEFEKDILNNTNIFQNSILSEMIKNLN